MTTVILLSGSAGGEKESCLEYPGARSLAEEEVINNKSEGRLRSSFSACCPFASLHLRSSSVRQKGNYSWYRVEGHQENSLEKSWLSEPCLIPSLSCG